MSAYQYAKRYSAAGLPPLVVRSNEKRAALKGWKEMALGEVLTGLKASSRKFNLGIAIPENLMVLDIDCKPGCPNGYETLAALEMEHSQLPHTLTQITPSGGEHRIFKLPPGLVVKNAVSFAPGLDTRAKGGLIVVEPSIIDGRSYTWRNWYVLKGTVPVVAEAPVWLINICQAKKRKAASERKGSIPEGERNNTIFEKCVVRKRRGFSDEENLVATLDDNNRLCNPPMEEKEVRAIVESACKETSGAHENYSDKGNARRLVQLFGEDIRYCYTLKKWLLWNGQLWAQDEDGAIMRFSKKTTDSIFVEAANEVDTDKRRMIIKHAMHSENASRLQAAITLANSESGIPIALEKLDADPMLMGVSNGVLDLWKGTLRNYQRSDYITKQSRVRYDPGAVCPRWLSFLDQIMCGDKGLVDFLQRTIGYSLTGNISEQCLFLLHGNGSNGKSTLLNVVKQLTGDYGMQVAPESIMVKRNNGVSNDIARLRVARFVATSETEYGNRLAESLVKQLTGGDVIVARNLYCEPFEFIPQFKIWLAANHKPVIRGDDYAIWRRIHLIPFSATFDEQGRDLNLSGKLMAELPGILNWTVQGCIAWQQSGLTPPDTVLNATQSYRGEMDMVHNWIEDCCVASANAQSKASELYESYRKWAGAPGVYVMNQPAFLRKLGEHGYEKQHTTVQGVNGVFYKGLDLLSEEEIAF